jgi:hypothetical protein
MVPTRIIWEQRHGGFFISLLRTNSGQKTASTRKAITSDQSAGLYAIITLVHLLVEYY